VNTKREFIIPFVGLKIGFHDFTFEVRDSFFEALDYSIIEKGNVTVDLKLEKKETMLIGEFLIDGRVLTACDRCSDEVEVPVKGSFRLIYKFGNEESDDETLIVLPPDAYELDISQNIYELITVSLPTRLVHEPGKCNEEMIALLEKYSGAPSEENEENEGDDDEDDDVDPRWSALKNLN
jgi:uncharacterized metal-binding protein YceD (DUF177 family)